MDEIKVLDSKIFNRIAAGEVVEGPKSIIKELIENSIDAGADKISIEIESGGIKLIKVVDNGKGIFPNDLKTAFSPHATSKISKLEDLDAISTLGFRGEALPSIASVSTITMISKKANSEIGYTVKYNAGNLLDEGEVGCPTGTTVLVENLFENIPARSKFLKKPSQEESEVSELIIKIILANPLLSIKYTADGILKYHSVGEGVKSAIFSIYGKDTIDNLTLISNTTSHIVVNGYISKPSYSKHNRNYQTLIVNGRYILNQELSFCIGQCYQEFLMKRQFPMYVLYLDVPLDMVDVNIQPNKMNVKFVDFARVKGIIYNAIKNIIDKENKIPKNLSNFMSSFLPAESITTDIVKSENTSNKNNENFNTHDNDVLNEPSSLNIFSFSDNQVSNAISNLQNNNYEGENVLSTKLETDNNEQTIREGDSLKIDFSHYVEDEIINKDSFNDATQLQSELHLIHKEKTQAIDSFTKQDNTQSAILKSFYSEDEYFIVGKLFNTYIIIQKNNEVLLIDQHAAHEKIIYDKMIKSIDNSQILIQGLLVPYDFEISNNEKVNLDSILPFLKDVGFSIINVNDLHYAVTAIPALLSRLDLKDFVSNLLSLIDENCNIKPSVFIKEKLMQTACKAAVKGEMDLSDFEIKSLLDDMNKNNVSLFCPHGRPIVITLERNQIEKWFKRVI